MIVEGRDGLTVVAPRPEFEGLDMGEFSGGMVSCLRRNDERGRRNDGMGRLRG